MHCFRKIICSICLYQPKTGTFIGIILEDTTALWLKNTDSTDTDTDLTDAMDSADTTDSANSMDSVDSTDLVDSTDSASHP